MNTLSNPDIAEMSRGHAEKFPWQQLLPFSFSSEMFWENNFEAFPMCNYLLSVKEYDWIDNQKILLVVTVKMIERIQHHHVLNAKIGKRKTKTLKYAETSTKHIDTYS